jgi:hypothetical protein
MPGSSTMQQHHHRMGVTATREPAQAGQDAFGAIAEIVGMLDGDPKTDWSRVVTIARTTLRWPGATGSTLTEPPAARREDEAREGAFSRERPR